MADYKQNIGASQSDFADGEYKQNIGAYQTDPPSFAATTIPVEGVGTPEVSDLIIRQTTEPEISGEGAIDVLPVSTNIYNIGSIIKDIILPIIPGQEVDQGSGDAWSMAQPTPMTAFPGGGSAMYPEGIPAGATKHDGQGIIRGQELPWFEIAHLLPRLVQDLGNIVSDTKIDCELYNADRRNAITVSSIVNNLGYGIVVSGVPATPFDIDPQEGLVFDVTVLRSGDLTIDGTYTLILSTGEEYTLYFIGSRIVLLPIRPEAPMREHLIFDTKIIEAVDGTEQRIANRQYPRGMFEVTFKDKQRDLEMILFDRQAKAIAMPAWHEPSFLSVAASVTDTTITVQTTNYANLYVGGYAIIMQDGAVFDALKIKTITPTTIEFESELTWDYAVKTQVMPLLVAYIEANTASIKYPYNQQYFNMRIHVQPEVNDIADDSAWSSYNGKPFLDDPNMVKGSQLSEALRTRIFVIDNLTGLRTPVSPWDHNKRFSKKGWKTNNRQELWELRQLLHFLKGKQVGFYIPTFWKDLIPNADMQIGTSVLNIEWIGYTANAAQRWPKQVIRVILKDGSIFVRTIQNSAVLSSTTEQLTLDASWDATYEPDDIERIEFLEKVRLNVDDITIIHYNALGQAECIVPIKEVE